MNTQNRQKDLLAEEWLKRARDDELNANSILTHRDGTPSGVCFLSHQMAEKYFKAYLVSKIKRYPKIHFLDELTEICMKSDSAFIELKDAAVRLDPFYTPARYPGDYPELNWQEAEQAFEAAIEIRDFILSKMN